MRKFVFQSATNVIYAVTIFKNGAGVAVPHGTVGKVTHNPTGNAVTFNVLASVLADIISGKTHESAICSRVIVDAATDTTLGATLP